MGSYEQDRVQRILDRDRADRIRETERKEAEMQVASGNFANMALTVVEPTPEWSERVESSSYTPRQPDGTTRIIKTRRRLAVPSVVKLCSMGRISFEQMMACRRYQAVYEMTGLDGHTGIGRYGIQGTLPGSGVHAAQRIPITEAQSSAREEYRAARQEFKPRHRRFFEAIVLGDLSPRQARCGACRNGHEIALFAALANRLVNHYAGLGIVLVESHGQRGG